MALSDAALTTVAALAKALGVTVDNDNRGDLEELIEDASSDIAEYIGRALHREDDIVEQHVGDGSVVLLLARRPLLTVSEVDYDGTTLPASAYEIQDPAAGAIFFLSGLANDALVAFGAARDPVVGTERRLYTVTYSAGYVTPAQADTGGTFEGEPVTLPRSIQRACIELASSYQANPVGDSDIKSESALSYSVTYGRTTGDEGSDGLPAGVRARLEKFVDAVFS